MNHRTAFLLVASLLGLSQCKKQKEPSPEEQLPPATQTGANTIGFLLNGQPWIPSGNNGQANYRVSYDPGFHGGNLAIRAYRQLGNSSNLQNLLLGGDRIAGPGTYPLELMGDRNVYYTDDSLPPVCSDYNNPPRLTYRRGTLTITRLDLQQGIISGTFSFTLYQPGCDSVKVTNGRFDKKL